MKLPAEPTAATKQLIAEVCIAWAALEATTEHAIWGILKLDMTHGPLVTWRLDMKMRWSLLIDEAEEKLPSELPFLKKINKHVTTCTRDRNIVVHGLVYAMLEEGAPEKPTAFWTIFRGADSGKKFLVTEQNARIIRDNIQLLAKQMLAFNERLGFKGTSLLEGPAEESWPKLIGATA